MPSVRGMRNMIRRKKRSEASSSSSAAAAGPSTAPIVSPEETSEGSVAASGSVVAAGSPPPEATELADVSAVAEVSTVETSVSESAVQAEDASPNVSDSPAAIEIPQITISEPTPITTPESPIDNSAPQSNASPEIIDIPFNPPRMVRFAEPLHLPVIPPPPPPSRPPPPPPFFPPPPIPFMGPRPAPSIPNSPPGTDQAYNGSPPFPGGPVPAGDAGQAQNAPEVFPHPPYSPLHRNQMRAPEQRRSVPWQLPGNDRYPHSGRAMSGHWMSGPFEQVRVGGRVFMVPMRLVQRYQFWAMMANVERPPQGWVMPGVSPEIFTVLLESVYSPSGLQGIEPGLNLVKILHASVLAWQWGMLNEQRKLEDSARRYIARRILYRNPFLPDPDVDMDHNYFVFRSEEIYRTWELAQRYPMLEKEFSTAEMVALFVTTVPQDLWPALTSNFKRDFTTLIDVSAAVRQAPAEHCFEEWWLRFYKLAGFLHYHWYSSSGSDQPAFIRRSRPDDEDHPVPPHARAEFEEARARGEAILAAFSAGGTQAARAAAVLPIDQIDQVYTRIDNQPLADIEDDDPAVIVLVPPTQPAGNPPRRGGHVRRNTSLA